MKDRMHNEIKVTALDTPGAVGVEIDIMGEIALRVASLQDQMVREQLIKQGWLPPPRGMAVQALAAEIVEALLADEKDSGYDLEAGIFGTQFSALVRRWAASETKPAPPIDMVLYCPNCGVQHIDKDNCDEIRIRAAELGVDREGDRAYSDWLEEHEWNNPPHRSHLCHSCGTIWRPADVATNGVQAIKTKGKADTWVGKAPFAAPAEKAE